MFSVIFHVFIKQIKQQFGFCLFILFFQYILYYTQTIIVICLRRTSWLFELVSSPFEQYINENTVTYLCKSPLEFLFLLCIEAL